ncbi:contractile injection system tape measure protein [Solitalea sp. MAHUQ-68]|uniref:Contractile injection system tape measure protein n=1 Tax=Solitalea agri TaxID=2953739 RepID=A0A9X2JGI4_9SPHI|nr:contractile injection system tape measure protein [Solitalea agri]MCO4294461.1 contractile injection system tape measure protein [Solitalea agri]
MSRVEHKIQKQFVEVQFSNIDDAFGMQNRLTEVFYDRIQPQIEVLFNALFGENYFAAVEHLEIDCGVLNTKNWEDEFTIEVIRKLKEKLILVPKKEIDLRTNQQQLAEEAFFFFLEHGYLQWNYKIQSINELESLLLLNDQFIQSLKKQISDKKIAVKRLAYQFSERFVDAIIAAILKGKTSLVATIKKQFKDFSSENEDQAINDPRAINAVLLKILTDEKTPFSIDSDIEFVIDRAVKLISQSEESSQSNSKNIVTNEIYLNNAGLVLLHPFLPVLFEELNLMSGTSWISNASQNNAMLVLEYLTTGNEEFQEFDLTLNKVLCGGDIEAVVFTDIELEDNVKNECDLLLQTVIQHWSALKNTSIEALRSTFLQRQGKLTQTDEGWLLVVEQKAYDVLIDKLPWGFGTIKLPWMNGILHTEWC